MSTPIHPPEPGTCPKWQGYRMAAILIQRWHPRCGRAGGGGAAQLRRASRAPCLYITRYTILHTLSAYCTICIYIYIWHAIHDTCCFGAIFVVCPLSHDALSAAVFFAAPIVRPWLGFMYVIRLPSVLLYLAVGVLMPDDVLC